MVELLFPRTLSEDMKDVFRLPRGLGLRGVSKNGWVPPTASCVYYIVMLRSCQYDNFNSVTWVPIAATPEPIKGEHRS